MMLLSRLYESLSSRLLSDYFSPCVVPLPIATPSPITSPLPIPIHAPVHIDTTDCAVERDKVSLGAIIDSGVKEKCIDEGANHEGYNDNVTSSKEGLRCVKDAEEINQEKETQESSNDEERHIVTTLLIDMKRTFAQKLYRFAVSAGSKGKGGNQPQVPKEEWKVAYTKEDIAAIVKTDPIDAIQRLVLSSGF